VSLTSCVTSIFCEHCLSLDVELEMFSRFNKIRALVDDTQLLAKALSKSDVLQVIACAV